MKKKNVGMFIFVSFALQFMNNSFSMDSWVITVDSMDDRLDEREKEENNNNELQNSKTQGEENGNDFEEIDFDIEDLDDDPHILAQRALLISEGERNKKIEFVLSSIISRCSNDSESISDRGKLLREDSLGILRNYKQAARLFRSRLSQISEEYDSPEHQVLEFQRLTDEDNRTKITRWVNEELYREIRRYKTVQSQKCSWYSTVFCATLTSMISLAPFFYVSVIKTCG